MPSVAAALSVRAHRNPGDGGKAVAEACQVVYDGDDVTIRLGILTLSRGRLFILLNTKVLTVVGTTVVQNQSEISES